MLNFDFLEKGLGTVSPPHFVYDFSRKIVYMLCSTKLCRHKFLNSPYLYKNKYNKNCLRPESVLLTLTFFRRYLFSWRHLQNSSDRLFKSSNCLEQPFYGYNTFSSIFLLPTQKRFFTALVKRHDNDKLRP